jgi:peptide/nickel transport system substrate-binding protein
MGKEIAMRQTTRATLLGGLTSAALVAGVFASTGLVSATSVHHRAASGSTLVFALPPQTQIPWYFPYTNASNASLYTSQLLDQMYMPLIYIGDNYDIDYANSLASKITYNKAGTVYHVFLNPKWKWSNGQSVTAYDAQFGWNVLLATENPNAPAPWPNYNAGSGDLPTNAKSFVVNNKYEFTVTLKSAVNQMWFIYNGLGTLAVLPSSVMNKYPTNITQEIKYLGKNATNYKFDSVVDGPFELQSATEGQAWVLVPNPDFAGHKSTLSKVVFQYEASDAAEFAGLKTGTIQVGYLPAADWTARTQLTLDTMHEEYGYNYFYTLLNMNAGAQGGVNAIFDNLYVREALYESMDNSAVASVIYHGQAMPQYGPIPPTPKTSFLDPALAKPLYPYSLTDAKAILTSHGWKEVNGVMTKGSEKMAFTLLYPSGDQAQEETAELLQADWAKIGVKITLKPTELVTEFGLVEKPGSWQMATGIGIIYGGSYPSGEDLFYKNQGLDSFGWNNAEENKLVEATIMPAATPAANTANFFAYEYYTAKELPTLWMPDVATDDEVSKDIVGFTTDTANPVTGAPLINYWSVK